MLKIKKGDTVKVIAGKDRDRTASPQSLNGGGKQIPHRE